MDALKFSKMLSDKYITDYKKLKYKYPDDFDEFIELLKSTYYTKLPIKDFNGNNIVYLPSHTLIDQDTVKVLYTSQKSAYGNQALEKEIISTSAIETIDFNVDSVRNIMKGLAPKDEEENRILGLKKGYEYISNPEHKITEENIHELYMTAIGNFLDKENQLKKNQYYRHDSVYVMSDKVEHNGIDYRQLPKYMKSFVKFANDKDKINDLVKAAILHFYIAYLHPYFDGNGRIARLIQAWYLVQKGFESTLFVSLSSYIEKSRNKYYNAYTLAELNSSIIGTLDITAFIKYIIENVYNKIPDSTIKPDTLEKYKSLLLSGEITQKESELWNFVLSNYYGKSFSTKRLEKDYGNAAYATIRKFCMKFSEKGLLNQEKFSNKTLYSIN